MKVLCKHCQLPCKRIGHINCNNYNAKADRPNKLKEQINQAYANGNNELAKQLQEELFKFWYGDKKFVL